MRLAVNEAYVVEMCNDPVKPVKSCISNQKNRIFRKSILFSSTIEE
ncbi:MAG: hypothetical protein KIG72_10375 [Bradymonadales bacterium]|nr:hypothetical protein [Bradymonadales bacterium]